MSNLNLGSLVKIEFFGKIFEKKCFTNNQNFGYKKRNLNFSIKQSEIKNLNFSENKNLGQIIKISENIFKCQQIFPQNRNIAQKYFYVLNNSAIRPKLIYLKFSILTFLGHLNKIQYFSSFSIPKCQIIIINKTLVQFISWKNPQK